MEELPTSLEVTTTLILNSEILIRSEFQMALLHKRIDHFGPSFWVTKPLGSQVCQ